MVRLLRDIPTLDKQAAIIMVNTSCLVGIWLWVFGIWGIVCVVRVDVDCAKETI